VRSKSPFTAIEDSTPRSWCPCIVVLQKSVGRLRAQRSAPSAANGSKARSKQEAGGRGPSHKWNHPARKRRDLKRASAKGHSRRREDGSFERRQSSSRERRISTKAPRSARASARVVAEKLLAMEGISGRRSARLSRGPRGTDLGGLRALASIATRSTSESLGGGDRDVRGGLLDRRAEESTPHVRIGRVTEVKVAP